MYATSLLRRTSDEIRGIFEFPLGGTEPRGGSLGWNEQGSLSDTQEGHSLEGPFGSSDIFGSGWSWRGIRGACGILLPRLIFESRGQKGRLQMTTKHKILLAVAVLILSIPYQYLPIFQR